MAGDSQTHDALKPLTWLIGNWKSISAEGSYPTIESFTYNGDISFKSMGQPLLNYTSYTSHPIKGTPMYLESGFLRIKPDTNKIAFMIAHNTGITSVEEGSITEGVLSCKSTEILRMSFAKDPAVISIERTFKLNEEGNLEIILKMETDKTPLTDHLKAVYQKL